MIETAACLECDYECGSSSYIPFHYKTKHKDKIRKCACGDDILSGICLNKARSRARGIASKCSSSSSSSSFSFSPNSFSNSNSDSVSNSISNSSSNSSPTSNSSFTSNSNPTSNSSFTSNSNPTSHSSFTSNSSHTSSFTNNKTYLTNKVFFTDQGICFTDEIKSINESNLRIGFANPIDKTDSKNKSNLLDGEASAKPFHEWSKTLIL